MSKILVIDHNPEIGRNLSQFLSSKGHQAAIVPNGVEAAKILRHDVPDLTIIDQEVPMTGIKTAQILRMKPENHAMPILLGLKPGAPEHTRQTLKIALQNGISWVIARPYKPEHVLGKIQEYLAQVAKSPPKKLTPDQMSLHIRKHIRALSDLPTLSPAQQRLIGLLSVDDDQVNMDGLIDAIQSDQGLTVRTLRIARSAGYGYQGNLLPTAVTFLGIKKMRQIVQSATILEIFNGKENETGFDYKGFWEHSVACGMVMQLISRDNQASKHFMAGLLHDVGKLILDFSFAPFSKVIQQLASQTKRERFDIERELIGISHAEIGLEVANLWDLPNEITESIANHHAPSSATRHKLLTGLVYTADIVVRQMKIGQSGNYAEPELTDSFAQKLRLPMSIPDLLEKKEELCKQIESIVNA